MKIEHHDIDQKVLVIAEIGNNHEGNFSLAQDMIGLAAEAGADSVKFQTFKPEYLYGGDLERLKKLRDFQLSKEQFTKLAKQASELGIIFLSTPFDRDSAEFLNQIQSVFKIASCDNDFIPLIRQVAGFKKPMIVSTGLADLSLLDQLKNEIKEVWFKSAVNPGLALLHCVSSYPTPIEQANLKAITTLKKSYPELVIGYSDHTQGIKAAITSVALGARIVEKHFTIDKNYSEFRDHQLSADPKDLKQMVESIRETSIMLGQGQKTPQENEKNTSISLRRSAAAARNLDAGITLRESDLIWIRPGSGIPLSKIESILGKSLKRNISYAKLIKKSDISE